MMATASKGKTISLEYTLKLDNDQVVETNVGEAPLTYTQGAHQIVRGVETAVEGMTVGEAKQVIVTPADGYGVRDLTALHELPKQESSRRYKGGHEAERKGS
jgi:FKBP-type peptidyl-prolyl cis-trans isomerase 2